MKHSVQNASYEQKDPLLIFKLESVNLFDNMVNKMNDQTVSILMRGQTPEPDPDPIVVEGDLSLDYSINRWVGGAMVSFKVINNSGNAVNTWTLKIKKSDCPITSSWNVNVKESGNYYVITPVEWNSYIPNGSQIEFGAIVAESVSDSISYTLD